MVTFLVLLVPKVDVIHSSQNPYIWQCVSVFFLSTVFVSISTVVFSKKSTVFVSIILKIDTKSVDTKKVGCLPKNIEKSH